LLKVADLMFGAQRLAALVVAPGSDTAPVLFVSKAVVEVVETLIEIGGLPQDLVRRRLRNVELSPQIHETCSGATSEIILQIRARRA